MVTYMRMNVRIISGIILLLLAGCKTQQIKHESDLTGFYSPRNKCYVFLYAPAEKSGSDLTDRYGKELVSQLPGIGKPGKKRERISLRCFPVVTDSNSCEGLYAYSIRAKYKNTPPPSIRFIYGDTHPLFFAGGNKVVLFTDDASRNERYLNDLSHHALYSQLLQYKDSILKNEILVE